MYSYATVCFFCSLRGILSPHMLQCTCKYTHTHTHTHTHTNTDIHTRHIHSATHTHTHTQTFTHSHNTHTHKAKYVSESNLYFHQVYFRATSTEMHRGVAWLNESRCFR